MPDRTLIYTRRLARLPRRAVVPVSEFLRGFYWGLVDERKVTADDEAC